MSRQSRQPIARRAARMRPAAAVVIPAVVMAGASAGCAARPPGTNPEAPPVAVEPAAPRHAEQLLALVETFQPEPPGSPNRWSQVVRTAFLYSGALAVSEPAPPPARDAEPAESSALPGGFMLAAASGQGGPEAMARAGRFLDELESRGLLLHLHQIAEPCRLVAPPPDPGLPLTMQETFEQGPVRQLWAACAARMRIAAAAPGPLAPSDSSVIVGAFSSGMNLGRALCGRPMLSSLTNAHTVQNRMMLAALDLADAGELDEPTIASLLDAAGRMRLPHPADFLRTEELIGLDALERFAAQRAREQARAAEGTVSIAELGPGEAAAVFSESIDRAERLLREQLGEGREHGAAAPAPPTTLATLQIPLGRVDPGGMLASLSPPLASLLSSELEHRCVRAALETGLALERHRLRTGTYPDSLEALDAPPPRDPLGGDRPLGYRLLAGGGYALYSVGTDREDNGGSAPPPPRTPRDALAVPPRGRGWDYVIVGTRP